MLARNLPKLVISMRTNHWTLPVAILAVVLAGCAGAKVNADSSGYLQGYGDGCATASNQARPGQPKDMRDTALYDNDPDYRAGYTSGLAMCRMGPPRL